VDKRSHTARNLSPNDELALLEPGERQSKFRADNIVEFHGSFPGPPSTKQMPAAKQKQHLQRHLYRSKSQQTNSIYEFEIQITKK
jgi:hypothetical protein